MDYISTDLLKSNFDWWAPLLASLFTWINQTARIPEDLGLAIIVPTLLSPKKGNRGDLANYRPIRLLSIVIKLYASHLLSKLTNWLQAVNLLAEEQAGFRPGRSTLDQGLILHHLAHKCLCPKGGALYTAVIDFKSAFDLIPRCKLWPKFEDTNKDRRLLMLIQCL